MNRQKLLAISMFVLFSSLFLLTVDPALSAGGTTGTLTTDSDVAYEGQTIVVKCSSLTASADYSIEVDDTATFNWTCGSSETTRYFRITVPAGGADGMAKIELVDANVTVRATLYVQVSDPANAIPQDLLTVLFVAIIAILFFAGIIYGMKQGLFSR